MNWRGVIVGRAGGLFRSSIKINQVKGFTVCKKEGRREKEGKEGLKGGEGWRWELKGTRGGAAAGG